MLTFKHICVILCAMKNKFYKKYLIFCLTNCLLSLVVGIVFYLLGRTNFFNGLGIETKNILLKFSFYLPDFLWSFALYYALSLIHKSLISAFIASFTGICWELLQQYNIVNGTFDFIDIFMYLMAILVAVIIKKLWRNKNEKNNT